MAITWQNVTPASQGDAIRLFESARQGMGDAFGVLEKTLNNRLEVGQQAADRARNEAKQGVLNRLQGIKTPEELLAMQQSGEIDRMVAGLDARDQAAVRPAGDARLADLRQQTTAGRKYGEDDWLFRNRDTLNAAQADLINAKTEQERDAAMGRVPLDAPNRAALLGNMNTVWQARQRLVSDLNTAAANQNLTNEQVKVVGPDSKARADQAAAATTSAAAAARNANTSELTAKQAAYEKAQQFGATLGAKLGESDRGVIGSPEGMDQFTKNMGAVIADKPKLEKFMGVVAEARARNPLFNSLPTDVMEQIAQRQVNKLGVGFWNAFDPSTSMSSTIADAMAADMAKALVDNKGRIAQREVNRTRLSEELGRHRSVIDSTYRDAFPQAGATLDAALAARAPNPAGGTAAPPASDTGTDVQRGGGAVNAPANVPPSSKDAAQQITKAQATIDQRLNTIYTQLDDPNLPAAEKKKLEAEKTAELEQKLRLDLLGKRVATDAAQANQPGMYARGRESDRAAMTDWMEESGVGAAIDGSLPILESAYRNSPLSLPQRARDGMRSGADWVGQTIIDREMQYQEGRRRLGQMMGADRSKKSSAEVAALDRAMKARFEEERGRSKQ
jgi:hypothetical protein